MAGIVQAAAITSVYPWISTLYPVVSGHYNLPSVSDATWMVGALTRGRQSEQKLESKWALQSKNKHS